MEIQYKGKTALITGGTGTWGQEIAKQLLAKGIDRIVIFSRNESAQVGMREKFRDDRLKFIVGDIRNLASIDEACRDVDYVIHTAALKHVIICENQVREAVLTNIIGTQNVINACINNNVKLCVNISSDKVCHPVCTYGKTKAVAESLIIEANNQTDVTNFISFRSGNIFGSSGSVVPLWVNQIKTNNYINITGENMKRFFILVEDAVKLIFHAMLKCQRGEVFVPKMDCFMIKDLADIIVKLYGDDKTEIKYIPPFPYERNTEWLVTPEEDKRTLEDDEFYIVYPLIQIKNTKYPIFDKSVIFENGVSMHEVEIGDKEKLWKLVKRAGF